MGASPMFVTLKKMSSLMWLMFFAFTLEFVPSAEADGDFLSFPKTASRSSELCCNDDHLLTCREVEFDPEDLSNDEIQLMGINFFFDNEIEPHGFVYKNSQGDEAIIDYHEDTGNLFGSINTQDGRSYSIEKCKDVHLWKEFDVESFEANIPEKIPNSGNVSISTRSNIEDRTTIATYSVMIYYTPEFAAVTADIEGWVDLVIEEANEGYKNSKIPIRVKKFCIEKATIGDKDSNLDNLKMMKGSPAATRNTADAAVLFSKDCPATGVCFCGVGYCCGPPNGDWTFSVTRKSCALGKYTFGHELGHNLGCHHNKEEDTNQAFPYGHGHLIKAGNGKPGSTTILAYERAGHQLRANYYSDPNSIYPPTGTPLGVKGISNNVKVITDNRIAFAALGDESGQCKSSGSKPSTTTTTAAPTTTTATGSCNVKRGKYFCSWDYEWVGKTSSNAKCKKKCKSASGCKGWSRFKSGEWDGWCGLTADISCEEEDASIVSGVLEC